MTIGEALRDIAERGRSPLLLGNAKLEWAGAEVYGEEAIAELFRTAPIADDPDALLLECDQTAAWFAGQSVLFADLYDGRIGRLWRLGPGTSPTPEPAISVAFDPDLHQVRGGVYFRLGDHPLLDPVHGRGIEAAGDAMLEPGDDRRQHRARGFLLRAFSSGDRAAGLFAVHRLSGGDVRSAGFSFAAVAIERDAVLREVRDTPPPSPWTPSL